MSKARLLHRENDEGCSHTKAVVHILRATSPEVALLMLSVPSAGLRLLTPLDRETAPEIHDAPTASPRFLLAAAAKPFRIDPTALCDFGRLVSLRLPAFHRHAASHAGLFRPLAAYLNCTPIARPWTAGRAQLSLSRARAQLPCGLSDVVD